MPLAGRQLDAAKRREGITGYDYKSLKLTFTHFGPRLLATAGGWFCNDVFFYGNKLYSSTFIKVVDPASSTSIQTSWIWSLINCVVELAGYYCACK